MKIGLFLLFGLMVGHSSLSQPIDSLLLEVVNNNPELAALNKEFEAEAARVGQVSQLPNPTLGVGVPALRPETRLGPQILMVGASQMFPWFGTLKSKKEIVVSMSKVKFERIAALKLELFFALKSAYYKLNLLEQKGIIIARSVVLYEAIENIALAKVESGQALISDVLRIQLKLQELNQLLLTISNNEQALSAVINQLTNHDWIRSIRIVDEFDEIAPLEFDTAAFAQKIRAHHPLMVKMNYQLEVSANKLAANKKMNSPKIGLGLDYNMVDERTDANPPGNGRDILVPKLMLNIPIYRKSYRSKEQEEYFIQESIAFKKEAFEDKMMRQLLIHKVAYDNAILEIELHQNQLETTNLAIEILLSNYSSTGKGFDDLLQLENQLLGHQIGVLNGLFSMRLAIAKIERITDF